MYTVLLQSPEVFLELGILLLFDAVFALDCGRVIALLPYQRFPRQTVDALGVGWMVALVEGRLGGAIGELSAWLFTLHLLLPLLLFEFLSKAIDAATPFVMVALRSQVLIFHTALCIILKRSNMYRDREALHQLINMCSQFFMKNQMTTVVMLLEPALPSENQRLLEILAKAYFSLGFYRQCRQVSLMAWSSLKAQLDYPEKSLDLCCYLKLIILSEIELNLAIAKEHEEELRKKLKDGSDLNEVLKEIAQAR